MKKSTYEAKIKKLRAYAKKINFSIRISPNVKNDEEQCDPATKTISIMKNQPYESIINTCLHELGHAFDYTHFPNLYEGFHGVQGLCKMEKQAKREEYVQAKRNEFAEKLTNPLEKKAVLRLISQKQLTPNQKKLIKKLKKEATSQLTKKILGSTYINYYKTNPFTLKQKEEILGLEVRAWDFGKKIAKQLKIKLDETYEQDTVKYLRTYQRHLQTNSTL